MKIELELSSDEAFLLKAFVQNPFVGSLGFEPKESASLRMKIWNALPQLEQLNGLNEIKNIGNFNYSCN